VFEKLIKIGKKYYQVNEPSLEYMGKRSGDSFLTSFIFSYVYDSRVLVFTTDKEMRIYRYTSEAKPSIVFTQVNPISLLKEAEKQGAIIEEFSKGKWVIDTFLLWNKPFDSYRIKDNISLESWHAHKDIILLWFSGAEIEMNNLRPYKWIAISEPVWSIDIQYRVKLRKMTLDEISNAVGYPVEVIEC